MTRTKYFLTSTLIAAFLTACSATSHSATVPAQPSKPIVTQAPTPTAGTTDLSKALSGEWVITAVGKTIIKQDDDIPYVTFSPSEKRFYANNGCNIINGSYELSPTGMLSFSNVLSTMRYCPQAQYDALINKVLNDGCLALVKFETIGNEAYLTLWTDHQNLMTLRRANMDFLNGNWRITEVNGNPIDDDEANIFFDIAEKKIHGNTGCNYFNGDIFFDPEVANSIALSNMGVTRMMCPKIDQERAMLVALEEANTVIRGGDDTAILLNASGKQVITLRRIPIEAASKTE